MLREQQSSRLLRVGFERRSDSDFSKSLTRVGAQTKIFCRENFKSREKLLPGTQKKLLKSSFFGSGSNSLVGGQTKALFCAKKNYLNLYIKTT